MKWIFICVVLVIGILLSFNCSQQQWRDIRIDAGEALVMHSEKGVQEAAAELDKTEKQLIDIRRKAVNLDDVITQASGWADSQKDLPHRPVDWMKTSVTPEGLALVGNQYYEVTALEVTATQNSSATAWDYSTTLIVKDRETGASGNPYTLKNELYSQKTGLEQQRKSQLDSINLAKSIVMEAIQTLKGWNVQRVNNIYVFSGQGLGWANGLCDGTWNYQFDKKEIQPADNAAGKLSDVLTAKR